MDRFLKSKALFLILCALFIACVETNDPQKAPTLAELEGPRGLVDTPGPWLLKAYLPDGLEGQIEVELQNDLGTWDPLPPIELNPSPRPDLWLSTLPILMTNQVLRYRLSTRDFLENNWREVRLDQDVQASDPIEECSITLIEPSQTQILDQQNDQGQAAGLQYQVIAHLWVYEINPENSHALKLTMNLGSNQETRVMTLTEVGLATFPLVTLAQGTQRIRLEGFTAQGGYCVQEQSLSVR